MTLPYWTPGTRLWQSIRSDIPSYKCASPDLLDGQLYHGIHARRERVEDVIEAAESGAQDEALIEEPAKQAAVFSQINDALSEDLEDGELEEEIDSAEHLNTGNSNGEIHVCATPCEPL